MNRRNVLRYAAYTVTGAAIYPLIQGCKEATAVADFMPSFFDEDQYAIIQDISDILIPETDTPGAISLGIPEFFDHMVSKVFPTPEKKNFQSDFAKLTDAINSKSSGGSFSD